MIWSRRKLSFPSPFGESEHFSQSLQLISGPQCLRGHSQSSYLSFNRMHVCPSVLSFNINKHEYRLSYRRIWNRRTVVCSFPGVFLCCDLPLMDLACFVGSTIKPTHPPTNPKTQQTGVFWCISDIRSKPRLKIIRSKNEIQPKVGLQNTRSDLR